MRPRTRLPAWVVLVTVVLVLTGSALLPMHEPRLPGTLRVGVAGGEDPAALERAVGPFADYLGLGLRRSAELVVLPISHGRPEERADLLLVPVSTLQPGSGQILAFTKPVGRSGARVTIVLARRADAGNDLRSVALGDTTLFGGPQAAAEVLAEAGVRPVHWAIGSSVYHHDEALALLRHGTVDAAVVARTEWEAARARGWFSSAEWRATELGSPRPRLALVASASLSAPARRRIRERALNLDHLRHSSRDVAVEAALQGLAQLGIGGFAPTEPFPALRP